MSPPKARYVRGRNAQAAIWNPEGRERTLDAVDATKHVALVRAGAWVDVLPGSITGAHPLFERLVEQVPWYTERRQTYHRVVAVLRLVFFYWEHARCPDPVLDQARDALTTYYTAALGEPFRTADFGHHP
jgi:hypothetical protein